MVWLVWDGIREDRDVRSIHATRDGAVIIAAELIRRHEVSRAHQAAAYPDRSMYRGPVQHSEHGDCESWHTSVWGVSIERRDVER